MNICGSVPRRQLRLSHNHGVVCFKVHLFLFSFQEDPRIIFKVFFDGGNPNFNRIGNVFDDGDRLVSAAHSFMRNVKLISIVQSVTIMMVKKKPFTMKNP